MKIAWFTPFKVESAIGRYSKFAVEALSKYVEVDLFVSQDSELHETECKVIRFDSRNVEELLHKYDLAVYNMGDNAEYHKEIYDVAQCHPGVIISHDICLHNFMRGYYLDYKRVPEQFKLRLKDEFGVDEAGMLWDAGMDAKEYVELDFLKYNFSKNIAKRAFGVIVHSQYHKKYMEQYYRGDMIVVPILNMNDNLDNLDDSISFHGYKKNKLHVLTVGNINANKRIHSIIEVLGQNAELSEKIDYTIIGAKGDDHYFEYLNDLIDDYNLHSTVNIVGFVGHKELAYYYQGADIISNLRYPAYEGASGSIAEQLAIGKCCMVSDTGVYAEIDDDCVIKIDPHNEIKAIRNILSNILKDSASLEIIGKNAQRYADEVLDRNAYAQKVYRFLKEIVFQRPLHMVKDKCLAVMEGMPTVGGTNMPGNLAKEIICLFEK